MRIVVVGLGYVGTVVSACLAESGHEVHAVDISQGKVAALNAGTSPVAEIGLGELVASNVARGRLSAGTDISSAVLRSEVVVISVGTPSAPSGDVGLDDLDSVLQEVGAGLRDAAWQLVMVASTIPPGTTEGRVIPALEKASGKRCGSDFGVAFSPEFLREGSAVRDYLEPAKTVVGANDARAMERAVDIFRSFTPDVIQTSIRVAETVKLADNAWHATKVAFSNEIGRFCEAHGIDSHAVMDIFKSDSRLNISAAYLTPGFAFGGSCLPKDLRTLTYRSRVAGVETPLLESVLRSNRAHVDLALRRIQETQTRRVAILGLAFKPGTDDLRESPMLELAERLYGKGVDVVVHDEYVNLAKLVGSNREHVMTVLPHIASMLIDDIELAVKDAETIVVAQANPAYAHVADLIRVDQRIIDLCGIARPVTPHAGYQGFLW